MINVSTRGRNVDAMANRTKATDRAREQFLAVLRTTCNVSEACRACGFSRSCAYEHRNADPEFARAWDEAEQEAADRLEREAWRRAVEGVDKPITYQGEVVGYTKEYSDRMLELLLKAHRPEKFRLILDSSLGWPRARSGDFKELTVLFRCF
jgi:hypothetical protein